MYVKIASCYSENMSSLLKSAMEETIGEPWRGEREREREREMMVSAYRCCGETSV